jgi:sorbitol/mannitol transport system permease protein
MTTGTRRAVRVPVIGSFLSWCRHNWLVAPALLYAIVVTQAPFILTIWYSLQRWYLLRPDLSGFNGLNNYIDIFQTSRFTNAILTSLVMTSSAVILSLLIGLAYAELVNARFPGRAIVRTMLITPFLVMPVVTALTWKNVMYSPTQGVLDWIVQSLGGRPIDWLASFPLPSVVVVVVWRWAPFMMLILLAGMQAIDEDVREAARVDGADSWQEFRHIVLPHLAPYMQLCILLGSVFIVNEFDSIYVLTFGGPGTATTNFAFLVFQNTFTAYDIGHSAAMAVIVVLITIVLVTFLLRLLGRLMEESFG